LFLHSTLVLLRGNRQHLQQQRLLFYILL